VVAAAVPASATLNQPVVIEAGATIGPYCVIGPRVYLERDVCVGEHAHLTDVVALRGACVPPGAVLTARLIAPDLPVAT
jgi:UDP-3-O-[3-hydroxymyristoyl] glucosamine N-acyltransferase